MEKQSNMSTRFPGPHCPSKAVKVAACMHSPRVAEGFSLLLPTEDPLTGQSRQAVRRDFCIVILQITIITKCDEIIFHVSII